MPSIELYSKRQKKLHGQMSDVFAYEDIPETLRIQIIYIIQDAIDGTYGVKQYRVRERYKEIHDILAREYGRFKLHNGPYGYMDDKEILLAFFLKTDNHEEALDVIKIAFQSIELLRENHNYIRQVRPRITPEAAIEELNARFLEHALGYRYEAGEIIRIDSELVHAEVTKPALDLLRDNQYAGANQEFLNAHEHYRHGRYEETLTESLNAFESTMKVICHKRSWPYAQTDTAKKLIEICFTNNLVPSYLQSEFTALRTSLESGVPTVRNKQGGHGQGVQLRTVPPHLAGYLLHLTAANILLLVNCEKALP